MTAQFRNLVFEGGGVKGIAFVGAMSELRDRDILKNIKRVAGTSAGAINALIYALGYSIEEQQGILNNTKFSQFMDDSFGVIRDINRLNNEFGVHKGDYFRHWIGDLIEKKLGNRNATFKELSNSGAPDLYVVGTNLSTGYTEVFSVERHPTMQLAEAVRISMSIPLFFAAVRLGSRQDVYVDGGVQLNYPVKIFDRERYVDMDNEPEVARRTDYYDTENETFLTDNPTRSPYVYNCQTLGLRLDTKAEIGTYRYDEPVIGKPIESFIDYARALISALMNTQENIHLHSDDWQRTIYIDTLDVKTVDFNITGENKKRLIDQGVIGAKNYFEWFDDPNESPVNKMK
jgi:NTE family protein